MKSKDEPDIPTSIYNVLPKDEWTKDEGGDVENEGYMFLYGSVFRKEYIYISETYAEGNAQELSTSSYTPYDYDTIWDWTSESSSEAKIKYSDVKAQLSKYKNFVIEPVDQLGGKRFLIARQIGDESSVNIFNGRITDRGQYDGYHNNKANLFNDSEVIAFYPSIPHNQKQLCISFQGKMIWIPYEQFSNESDTDKQKLLTALHIFLMNEDKSPMQVYDQYNGQFLSRTGGYLSHDELKPRYYSSIGKLTIEERNNSRQHAGDEKLWDE